MEYAAFASVGLGLALVLIRGGQLFGLTIQAMPFAEMVGKLARAKNYERALKLCDAAPKAVAAATIRGGIAEMIRTSSATDAASGFETARIDQEARLVAGRKLALGGIALALAGAMLVASTAVFDTTFDGVCGAALAVAVIGVWTMARERSLISDATGAWQHHVLPVLREAT
jgi:hypothetical protein|nr:hypothetical protein [Kofleriaceae bacterium]